MNILLKHALLGCSLLFSLSAAGQVSQDLIDKAKAAGMTDAQIQQEISKRMEQTAVNENPISTASVAKVSDRSMPTDANLSIEQQRAANTPKDNLEQTVFGREIFSNKNLSFSPELNIPTPKNYILAAGDEVLINVWGDSELNLKLKISPDGTIIIPNVGPVALSGLTIEAAESKIRHELGQIISTLVNGSDGGNTSVSLSLGQIRSMKVHIVGEAMAPGTYTLPSFATLFNALYAAGGVNNIGSLRSVKVYRNSKEVANLDVYAYLLRGKFDTNIRLEENDMIIVGPYEGLVAVEGKVKRNRIFEVKKGETLQQLLEMTGGFTGDAYSDVVQVKRKSGNWFQLATVKKEQYGSFVIQDGDTMLVNAVIPFYENRLTITGAVWRPGEYELNSSVHTVKQLISEAAGLKGDEFLGRAQLTRLNPDFTSSVVAVDIQGILKGSIPDIELQKEDKLYIPSLFDLREAYTIKVAGAVNQPKTFAFRKNMTVEDAIILAGGLKESAATVNVLVARRIKEPTSMNSINQRAKEFTFTLDEELKIQSGDELFTLEPFDEVYVRFSPGYQEQQVVKIGGEITFAGNYVLAKKNMRLSELIAKAGGVTSDAYIKGANLKRQLTEDEIQRMEALLRLSQASAQSRDSISTQMLEIKDYSVGIDLVEALNNPGSMNDVVLRDGDVLYIPQLQSTVKVSGTVVYPNSITYEKGMSVKDCLSQAGGYNDLSRKYPIVIYMNGKVATTKRTCIFFKRYPKVEPGCEILVPAKSQRNRKNSLAEILSIASSTTSMAAMVTSIINTMGK